MTSAKARPNLSRWLGWSSKKVPTIAARIAAPFPADTTPLRGRPRPIRTQARMVACPTPQGMRQNQPSKERRKARTQRSTSSGCRARHWATNAACSVSSETNPVRPIRWNRSTRPNRRAIARADMPSVASPKASPRAVPNSVPVIRSDAATVKTPHDRYEPA